MTEIHVMVYKSQVQKVSFMRTAFFNKFGFEHKNVFGYFPAAGARNECKINVFSPLVLRKIPTIRGDSA